MTKLQYCKMIHKNTKRENGENCKHKTQRSNMCYNSQNTKKENGT